MAIRPSEQRSSSFWATLGQQYLQVAENVLPQLGAAASDALSARYGGRAPDTTVTPNAEPANTTSLSGKTLLYGGLALLVFVLLFAAAGFGHHRR